MQVGWFAGCYDPPGDLYSGCFEVFAGYDPASGQLPPGLTLGSGNRFKLTLPDNVISRRPPPNDPKQPPYGLAYVFFAACAGSLGPAPASGTPSFPVACFDSSGKQLGADDFVAGYTAIYAFEKYQNENPIVTGFQLGGKDATPDCIGDACLDTPIATNLDCDKVPCIPACADDGSSSCPSHFIKPVVDRASAEVDQISVDAYGENFQEQMWIDYYVSSGGVKSAARLLNDATTGWNDDYGTEFYAPKKPGVVSIYAIVHDNRGGVSWARQEVLVQ